MIRFVSHGLGLVEESRYLPDDPSIRYLPIAFVFESLV